ncbi:branched-chain amino acid ABC transporter permease [Ruegeria pomeroyi]|nr:branched-chain amino acid ABC transporter permease [Ruegeria pomeroyi]
MYALASVGLSLIFGTLGMFNMAYGLFMTLGAYVAYSAANASQLPLVLGFVAAMVAGALIGVLTHLLIMRFMLGTPDFGLNVMVATAGLGVVLQDIEIKIYGGYLYPQVVRVEGLAQLGGVSITLQALTNVAVALTLILGTAWLLMNTRFSRAIRATAMNREAAMLMGVKADTEFLQVMALAGMLAGVAGLMISTQSTLSPQMGGDPLLKAFVICVVAGLGNVWGAGVCAFGLALLEAAIGCYFVGGSGFRPC